MPSIYLSASTQPGNVGAYPKGTSEMTWMHKLQGIMAPKLRAAGVTVYESPYKREGQYVDAAHDSNRKGVDLHHALHSDAGSASRMGSHTIYFPGSTEGLRAARLVQKHLEPVTPWTDFGVVARSNLYELKATSAPAILTEVSFHDKRESAQWIMANLEAIADALVAADLEFFGIKPSVGAAVKAKAAAVGRFYIDIPTWNLLIQRMGNPGSTAKLWTRLNTTLGLGLANRTPWPNRQTARRFQAAYGWPVTGVWHDGSGRDGLSGLREWLRRGGKIGDPELPAAPVVTPPKA